VLHSAFNKREIKFSLQVTSKVSAVLLHDKITANLNYIFNSKDASYMSDILKNFNLKKATSFEASSIIKNSDGSFEIQGFKSDPNQVDAELKMLQALGFTLPANKGTQEKSEPNKDKITFSELFDRYLEHAQPNAETLQQDRSICQIFIELFDDPFLDDINHLMLTNFVETIQKHMPTNAKKSYPKLTAKQIIKLNHPASKMMKPSNVNKYLGRIGVVFKYAVNHGLMDANYATGKTIREHENAREKRRPFTSNELRVLLNENKVSANKKPDLYWLVNIGAYSGMRLGEICQLQPEDIQQVDGIWAFDINNNHKLKSCKSSGSKRLIPIHSKIIKDGFIEFVQVRKGNEFLFGWKYHDLKKWGHYSGKSVNNFIKKTCSISEQSFHCFRHTVADCLMKNRTVSKEVQEAILGHALEGQSYGRYGKGFGLDELKDAIEAVKYDGA